METAFLTIKDAWAEPLEESAPNPPRLQLAVVPPDNADGRFAQDEDGNWSAVFDLTAVETADDLGPPPRFLWYEVTLVGGTTLLRPFVGMVRMLPVVYAEASS